jgi:beta-lactamase superfamily II metal-dependent hydrolase
MKINKQIIIWAVLVGMSVFGYLSFYIYKFELREKLLEVNFFSLDKSRSIFIRTPENHTILIGAGQNSEVIRELTKNFPFYSRKIDTIITPSASVKEIGGFLDILDRYEIDEVIVPKYIATSTILTEVLKKIRQKKIHVKEVERGDEIDIKKDLKMEVLFPSENFKYNKTSLPELGVEFEYKNTNLFLLGNLSKTIQKDIVKNISTSTTENLLEFYHSGIESRVSSELLDKINPKYIFNTKEKATKWLSDGREWMKN